jgi:hypothetical protein
MLSGLSRAAIELAGAISGANPRSADPHAAATKAHLAGLAAVPHGGPARVVAALAPTSRATSSSSMTWSLQAGPDRKGEQPLSGGASQLSNRDGHPLGQLQQVLVGGSGAELAGELRAHAHRRQRQPALVVGSSRIGHSLCRSPVTHTICPPE